MDKKRIVVKITAGALALVTGLVMTGEIIKLNKEKSQEFELPEETVITTVTEVETLNPIIETRDSVVEEKKFIIEYEEFKGYDKISKEEMDSNFKTTGNPLLIFEGKPDHWVLAVGYNGNVTSIKNDVNALRNNVYVLNPYSSGHNKIGSNVIYERLIGSKANCTSSDTTCTSTVKNKAYTGIYKYWDSVSDALNAPVAIK